MASGSRTIEDLERKYDFAKLLGLAGNVKMQSKFLIKVENELLNMLNSLTINLKDVLNNQSEVSLWFYSGTPTTSNKPYIDWTTPSDHDGDIYYDQATGYVYQYKYSTNSWVLNTDTNLIQAMVMTNVEIDTTSDHERKVYFSQPLPPYSSGDWWIKTDGNLFVCQLGRATGIYHDDDFITATKYTPTVASADGDVITIKRGQVIKMSDVFASFTDLATGGSTIINGANISTGTINTDNVIIGNDNVLIDEEGIKLSNGAKVVGENGLMNTYLFQSGTKFQAIGYSGGGSTYIPAKKEKLEIELDIPTGLVISSAKIILFHAPVKWDGSYWGYARNLKLYKATNMNNRLITGEYSGDYSNIDGASYSEVSNAFESSGYTPSAPTDSTHNTTNITSSEIKSIFQNGSGTTVAGLYKLKIETSDAINSSWGDADLASRTAFAYAILKIDGYMSYS